jgi:hypothetical protein
MNYDHELTSSSSTSVVSVVECAPERLRLIRPDVLAIGLGGYSLISAVGVAF